MAERKSTPGGDAGTWGTILNGYLGVSLDDEGNLRSSAVTTAGGEVTSNKDTDGTLAANSDTKYPSQKAVKTYADTKVSASGTTTLSNKRITRRVVIVTQSATPSINTDITDVASITGLAQAITSVSVSGTPVDGDMLIVRITDNGSARAISWGSSFEASTVALPTTTVASAMLMVGFAWNTATSKWRCIASA